MTTTFTRAGSIAFARSCAAAACSGSIRTSSKIAMGSRPRFFFGSAATEG
jgi:hypothetical protein